MEPLVATIFCLLVFNLILESRCIEIIKVNDPDEYMIGKKIKTDDRLFHEYFNLTENAKYILPSSNYKAFNNFTHFVFSFKSAENSCISAILLQSYPLYDNPGKTSSFIYVQKGGIGRNFCKVVFRKKEQREDMMLSIFGSVKGCSFKRRYTDSKPNTIDGFGLPYYFPQNDNWNYYQPNLTKYIPTVRREIFPHKNGLINKPIYYLDKSDKYMGVKEGFPKKKNFSIKMKNTGVKKISFLDVYWYQESQNENPKMPYIYFKEHCTPSDTSCTLTFDADELITYVFVKIFGNENSDMARTRPEDLGRGK
ncbi:hypothetical protein DMENIID0001_058810 [Sergentomyia squamirostris]